MATDSPTSPELLTYAREVSLRDDTVLRELRELTAELPLGRAMQVSAEEGQFLGLLAALLGAREVLEIGTFTGYAALCLARAVGPGGRVVTCDVTTRWPDIARPFWARAGVDGRIEVRIGEALATLADLREHGGAGRFDLVFVDADKSSYRAYYEHALDLVRPGGLVVIDNSLFFGRVVDDSARDRDTVAIRELNAFLHTDERVDITLLPLADGVTLLRRRETRSS